MAVGIVAGIQLIHSFFHCCHSLSVASIVSESDPCSESESDSGSNVEDVVKPFTLIEVVDHGVGVTDEEKNACLDFILKNSCIVVVNSPPLSNDLAVSLYEDKADSIAYQEGFEHGTMQHKTIVKIVNAANDDPNSSDPVGMFLGGVLESVEKKLGAKVGSSFLNLNRGQEKTLKSWHSDKIQAQYSGRAFVHYLPQGKQGAVHLRPVGIDLEVRINIPPGCVVYVSKEILGFESGNKQFPRFEHKHCNQGASMSWVLEHEIDDIEMIESDSAVRLRQPLAGKMQCALI